MEDAESVVKTSLKMKLPVIRQRRQDPAVSVVGDDTLFKFIVKSIQRCIANATPFNQELYKATSIREYEVNDDVVYADIVRTHREQLHPEALVMDTTPCPSQGIMSEAIILKHIHMFLAYGLWLQRATHVWETAALHERSAPHPPPPHPTQHGHHQARSPFQVIPQLTLRTRFMDFGSEQICELIQRAIVVPEVQALFNYDLIPSLDTRNLTDIANTQNQIQVLQTKLPQRQQQQHTCIPEANIDTKSREQLLKQTLKLAKLQDALRKRKRPTTIEHDNDQKQHKRQKMSDDDKWTRVSRTSWLHMIDVVSKTLFAVPKHLVEDGPEPFRPTVL